MKKTEQDKRLQMMDIARLAGVSASTVSRALSGSKLVNEETRQRIAELAQSLNYSVNASAKNLRLGYNRTLGVVIPFDRKTRQHVSDPFFLSMLGSLADAVTDRGHDLLLSRVDSDHLGELAQLCETGRVGAIAVIGQWGSHDQLNELAVRRIPFVVWGAQLPTQLYCCVGTDNVRGGYLATKHLLDLGRRHIAFMGDPDLPEPKQRHEGYANAHRELGLEVDPALLIRSDFTAEGAQSSMRKFLGQRKRFDGVFAASDLVAMNAMSVLQSAGKIVPDDVSVVGFDDIDSASHWHPALSTVRQPIQEAGVALVDCLIEAAQGRKPESRMLEAALLVRESSVPARS